MIPAPQGGVLPPGVHPGDWKEVEAMFGTTVWRQWLLEGLRAALAELGRAGCSVAYLDGSFVTDEHTPGDFDLCWEHSTMSTAALQALDPLFTDPAHLAPPRSAQKAKYRGDVLPNVQNGAGGPLMVEFFQIDRNAGTLFSKGIVLLDPRRVP
jgi:hypothetical protein